MKSSFPANFAAAQSKQKNGIPFLSGWVPKRGYPATSCAMTGTLNFYCEIQRPFPTMDKDQGG